MVSQRSRERDESPTAATHALERAATERGRPSHDFSRGACSCNDRWRWDGMVNEDDVPVKPRPEARDCPAPRADDDSERAPRRG